MRALLLAAPLALLLAPGISSAETCVALASGSWGPLDSGSVVWSCESPTPDDDFVVPTGIAVDVVDDILQDGTAATGITVREGGSLTARVSGASGALRVSLGPRGLRCFGTCELRAGYRSFAGSHPASSLPFPWGRPTGRPATCSPAATGAARATRRW